ncbi:helix-turn-helix transcriptional regulator [Sphingobacterium sp. UT-1RO-CII-1]|uniref:helix-turn-helix domain-containing protein n=1 Tax=Sphingobacterium sp. UT-1RO-CII-1 TaxID=2995225 RepID=UPI00227D3CF6|nr:helix-turn-helix transcriptional regulator [Sphingobacterium sp. UT-1RO-CII-1]MCY4780189.1 helix-turn-helix transcriptional regulator [Sphingobacterium sp. UT-1RO-CII-1]
MANEEFAFALKSLRLLFNLSQEKVATIAGIIQSDYSAFERQKRELTLNNADLLAQKIWGVSYRELISLYKNGVVLQNLPKETQIAIETSANKKLQNQTNFLALELDRLISEGLLNQPITSKQILKKMDSNLWNKNSIEITNLFNKAPRKHYIIKLDIKINKQLVYVHKDYAELFCNLSSNDLIELVTNSQEE